MLQNLPRILIFSCSPGADVESKMISSAYIKQCIGLSLRITGSEDFSKYLGSSFINILNKKILILVEEKKNNVIQSFCHIT
jgi:hypothetical protein